MADREPAPVSEPRIPDRDAFYQLAELSRHSSRWDFTFDYAAAMAPYTATNRLNPDVSVAASSARVLADLLDDIDIPNLARRYQVHPSHRDTAAQERAELDLLVGASPSKGSGARR
ncbi:hypothetical protein [Nocardiopsis rhodophaea]|uniref:hypothetical protein n=1 Tax=Nocardiopsis rhodophaea TaxID=280238 RepID=UPI0031D81B5D